MATASDRTSEVPQRLTRKGQETRRHIIAEAAALMYERGVAGTSVEDVQQAAGVSASQIYHYFSDKKSLVRAVVEHQSDYVLNEQIPLLSRLDSVEALEAWRDVVVANHRDGRIDRGCPIGSLSSELAGVDAQAHEAVLAGFARWEEALRDCLHAMRRRGELPEHADPARLALATLAAVQGGILLNQARRDTTALEAALDTLIDYIRRGTQHRDAGALRSP
jgi:TetR/AcrR family transcriptional repressor of nem operon